MPEATKHVLLGAGGSIANALARHLLKEGQGVRLVSRRGTALEGAESLSADLLDEASVRKAVETGSVVYLLAGLPYDTAVWRDEWPRIMNNVIRACVQRGARLIFFDNVYMYGRVDGVMTEATAVNPISRKGEVRARIAADLLDAVKDRGLKACIARAADFYGPGALNGVPHQLVFTTLSQGKAAQWLVNANVPHSFTFTPDCGRALPLLASADDVWGEVWHLPTAAPPLTGAEFVDLAARAFGRQPRLNVLAPWKLRMAGLFNRTIREVVEMLYQYEIPYTFDSSKFERRFAFSPTPFAQGIEETARVYASDPGGTRGAR
jgi:nucleoside-diphosphate-sugar epimerase